jgi:putative phosphoesterase
MSKSVPVDGGAHRKFDSIKTFAIISDTHGLLRDSVTEALPGFDLIVHAGDVGPRNLLQRLETIAPVVAVRGNVDNELACLAATELISVNDQPIYVLHDLSQLDLDPAIAGIAMVVSGHSHQPKIDRRDGVLYVNPGSVGPRRFRLPVSFARWLVTKESLLSNWFIWTKNLPGKANPYSFQFSQTERDSMESLMQRHSR